ncbi:MAG: alpha/beta hydrolase [Acidobacteriia bacterium]|nr:alpha/beta hydrolase [Terriglobia bacterium]
MNDFRNFGDEIRVPPVMQHSPQAGTKSRRRLLQLGAALPVAVCQCAASAKTPSGDVFQQLHRNSWYLPTADGRARLYVTSLGRGPRVVVLHGGPGNNFHYLVDAVRRFAGQCEFVLFDQRGSLFSPVTHENVPAMTLKTLAEDLEHLRRSLGGQRIVLFAHSFGALLALSYLDAHPERVAGLILTGTTPPSTQESGGFENMIRSSHGRLRVLRERPAVNEALREAGVAGPTDSLSERQKHLRWKITQLAAINLYHVDRWSAIVGGGVHYNARVDDAIGSSVPAQYDLTARLQKIPVAIIQGDNDYIDPGAKAWNKVVTSSTQVTVRVIHQAGHYCWIDNPASFDEAMEQALARVTAPIRFSIPKP